MNPNSIISLFRRYWIPLLALIVAVLLTFTNLREVIGAMVYAPALIIAAAVMTFLIRHFAFPRTIDNDLHTGLFVTEWRGLTPVQRCGFSLWVTSMIFLGACIVLAAVAK